MYINWLFAYTINVKTSDLEQHLNFETEYGLNHLGDLSVPRRKH